MEPAQLAPGLSAGFALGGAWLTGLGFFRRDRRIRVEEASYGDAGSTRTYLYLENARLGRLGVMCTAIAILIQAIAPAPRTAPPFLAAAAVAIITALLLALLGWLRSWVFRHWEHHPERVTAERVLRRARDQD